MNHDHPLFDDPDFVLDFDTKGPPPLDELVANVWLRPISNRFADGFDVEVSAFFGEEAVELFDDEFALSVDMALTKAIVELHFKHCRATPLFDPKEILSSTYEHTKTSKHSENMGVERTGKAGVDAILGLGPAGAAPSVAPSASASKKKAVGFDHSVSTTEKITAEKAWSHVGPTKLMVGVSGQKLEGRLLSGYRGWHVLPDPSKDFSAVVAALVTRPSWIEFGEAETSTFRGRIGLKAKDFLRTKSQRDRKLFELLLKNLSVRGLTRGDESDAMLAADVQVLRKAKAYEAMPEDRPYVLPPGAARHGIHLEARMLEEFLDLPASQRVGFLLDTGVSKVDLNASLQATPSESNRGLFVSAASEPRTHSGFPKMRVRVVVPTTAEPILVESIRRLEHLPLSHVVTPDDFVPDPAMTERYHALTDPAGPLRGLIDIGETRFELRVSQTEGNGRSWELPTAIAHWCFDQGFEFVQSDEDLVIWATGAVNSSRGFVSEDYFLLDKLRASQDQLGNIAPGTLVVILLPNAEEKTVSEFQSAFPTAEVASVVNVDAAALVLERAIVGRALASGREQTS